MKNKSKCTKKHFKLKEKIIFILSKIKFKILECSLEKPILLLDKISVKTMSIPLVSNFLLGTIILDYTKTMDYFFPHLVCLTFNIIFTLSLGSEYAYTIMSLDDEILQNVQTENIELREIYKRFRYRAFHILNLVLCVIVLCVFFWGIFSQHYITLNLVGCYAVYMVFITVSISVIGYAEYIWLLWFLYRVSNCSFMTYNKIIPAYTPFLVKIGRLTNHAKWCFFIEGFLYVFEYFILIPNGSITLSHINMPDNFSFIVTWLVIFFVIIVAFPIIIGIQEHLIAKIVSNLKTQEIKYLSTKLDILIYGNYTKFTEVYMQHWIIKNLIDSPDYPVKIQRLWTFVLSTVTFILHIANLINQYPQLKTYLINRLFGNSI
ncbi:MAG: hypothetical protein NC313_03535 [Butyrivibrio sp.]|nr:hypothetical protein [Butyrivibrio sp.]